MPGIQTHHDRRLFRRMRNRNLSSSHFVLSPRHFPTAPPRRQTVVLVAPLPLLLSLFLAPNQMLFGDSLSFKSPRRKDIRQLQQSSRLIPLTLAIMRFSLIKRNEEAPLPSVVRGPWRSDLCTIGHCSNSLSSPSLICPGAKRE